MEEPKLITDCMLENHGGTKTSVSGLFVSVSIRNYLILN
jgi:hypothetical protein